MSWDAWASETPEPKDPTWGDYGRTIQSGAGSALAGTAGVLRWAYDNGKNSSGELWKAVEDIGNRVASDASEGMTESGRKRFEAGITSPEFWEHPGSAMALKATGQLPNVVAMALPGGVINDARMAVAASMAVGGTLSAGDLVDGVIQKTDALSDDQLKEQSPLYRGLRADMGVREARTEYNSQMLGMKPAIAFALGAGSDFVGPAANVIRGVKGAARHGIGRGAAEGFTGEAIDEGGGAYLGQKAEIEGGLRQKYDPMAIIDQALTGGAMGGVLSGVSSIGGGHGKGKAKADEIRAAQEQGRGEEATGIQAETAGAEAAEPISPPATRSKAAKKGVTTGVDPAIEAALAAEQAPAPKVDVADAAAAAATPQNVPQQPSLEVAPPQQPSVAPPPAGPAAAPVTQEVTPAAPPQATPAPPQAAPALDERTLTELAKRGIHPDEAAQLNPQQIQEVMQKLAPGQATQTPQTPQAVASAPPTVGTEQESNVAASQTEQVPTGQTLATGPRVLQDVSEAGKKKVAATQAQVKQNIQKGKKAAADKVVSESKAAAHDKAAKDARDALMTRLFGEEFTSNDDPASKLALPKSKDERVALGERLKPLVAALKTKVELREDAVDIPHVKKYYNEGKKKSGVESPSPEERTRWHSSLPGRVGGVKPKTGEPRPIHTQYMRELVDVQKMLSGGKPLKPEQKRRVNNFIVAFNGRAADLIHSSRQEGGQNYATGKRTAAQQQAAETGTVAAGATIQTPQSFGPASEVRRPGGNVAAVAGAEALERMAKKQGQAPAPAPAQKPTGAAVIPEIKKKAGLTVAEKADRAEAARQEKLAKMPPKVAEKVKITEEARPTKAEIDQEAKDLAAEYNATHGKITEGTKPEPKVTSEVTPPAGMSEKARHAALRKWMTLDQINALSVKDQIAFLKDPPPVPAAPTKAPPPARPKRTEAEIEADELARENAERVAEIERDEARQREVREEIEAANAPGAARPTTERASAEEAAAFAPVSTSKPKVVTDKRAALKAALAKAREGKPGILRMAGEAADSLKRLQDVGKEAWVAKRLPLQENVYPLKDRQSREDLEADYDTLTTEYARRAKLEEAPGILKMSAMSDLDIDSMTDEQIDNMTDEQLAGMLEDLERISNEPKKGVSWDSDDVNLWESPLHKAHAVYGHHIEAMPTTFKASDVLRQLDLSHLKSAPQYIQDFVRRRLTEVLGNVKIHIANADLIKDATGDLHAPAGYFHPSETGPGYIAIQAEILGNRREFTHTVIHEALHAALYDRLNNSPKFQQQIKTLMMALDSQTLDRASRRHAEYALGITKPGQAVDYDSRAAQHEFIAEALSNPRLQQMMRAITIPRQLAEALGLPPVKKHTLWGAFTEKVRELLKLPPGAHNLLHETLQVIGPQLAGVRSTALSQGTFRQEARPQLLRRMTTQEVLDRAAVGVGNAKINLGGKLDTKKDYLSTMGQMVERGQKYFGPDNPLNQLFSLRGKMEHARAAIIDKYGGAKAALDVAKADREHPELMAAGKAIGFDLSLHDINPDGSNDHLGKDVIMNAQAKDQIARLKKAWNDPKLDPVRDVLRQAGKFFKDIHNAVSRETIKNLLAEANIHDEALVDRIHQDGLTEEDEKNFANTKLVSALNQVSALKQRQGFFIPFRRYGDYISAGEHELSVPKNGLKINDNTIQFVDPTGKDSDKRARVAARTYTRQASHTPQGNQLQPLQVRKVWVDKTNPTQIVEAEDQNAIPAYRVAMQTSHVEMHGTQAAAMNSEADLRDAGLLNARTHKREEAYRKDVTNIQSAMGTVLRSLEKQQRYIDADSTQKAAMREMFHDLTLGLSGTTSIKNSMRQRRNVAGMSQDLGRVTSDYASMTANHLARLQYRPQIDVMFKQMRDYMKARSDKDNIRREEIYKEFQDRIYGDAANEAAEHKPGWQTRLLQLTRLSFLAGPSFHIINSHEPWTTSAPVIGGRHGFIPTIRAIAGAYNLIGGRAAVVSGFKDTVKAFTNDSGFTDYVKLFKDAINKNKTVGGDRARRLTDMLDYANERNLYSNSASFEMAKFANPAGNIAGKALDRADLMANQVGSAIEGINRTVTLIPAYELEYKKNGGNHEAAMHYAYSTAVNTMGDYSAWNAAPAFNSKYGKLLFQFKKYPQKTYYLLGNIMGGVMKGDPQAMKQFAGLMVTHGLVAGALGMPTEPFKIALVMANAVGLTGFTPDDYDYAVRQMMANLFGKKGGEIASRGVYRGLGIELSGRMGLDSLLLRSTPKSQKDADIKSFLFDTFAGASASYFVNQVQGMQAAAKGDWTTAIEKMSPLRTVGDITKAAVGLSGAKTGPSGKTTQEQFSGWDATVRALGFTPSSAAELGASRGTQARESKRLSADRSAVINNWITATGHEKVDAQRAVQKFNANHPDEDEQITSKDLTSAAKRREREKKTTTHGVTASKRTKAIQERAESVFNL